MKPWQMTFESAVMRKLGIVLSYRLMLPADGLVVENARRETAFRGEMRTLQTVSSDVVWCSTVLTMTQRLTGERSEHVVW